MANSNEENLNPRYLKWEVKHRLEATLVEILHDAIDAPGMADSSLNETADLVLQGLNEFFLDARHWNMRAVMVGHIADRVKKESDNG